MHPHITEVSKLFEIILAEENSAKAYLMLKGYFEKFGPPICLMGLDTNDQDEAFYRCRPHLEGSNDFFYKNVSELSYRPDYWNIKSFGRCNEPNQSLFYASNNSAIAYYEISDLIKNRENTDVEYFTTGVWKINTMLKVNPIVESSDQNNKNVSLVAISKYLFNRLSFEMDSNTSAPLIDFMRLMASEFSKPFSINKKVYLLSAAYSNHVFNYNKKNMQVDGIVYPSCSINHSIRDRGLNFALRPEIIGFENKVEFAYAMRGKLIKKGDDFFQVEEIKSRGVDKNTGEILW